MPGPTWIPGDARYVGFVTFGGVVWRISEAEYLSPIWGTVLPADEVWSWIEPVFPGSFVSIPTYDPVDEVVFVGAAT